MCTIAITRLPPIWAILKKQAKLALKPESKFGHNFGMLLIIISRCSELVYIELSYYFVPTAVLKKERSGLRD